MMKKLQLIIIALFFSNIYSQKIIEMERINDVYQVPCKVNGIPMKFIFDTGASDVTISITEAKFLLKQGLLKKEDFIENVNYQIANGDIIEGTKIYLKTIDIDGIILKNVKAAVINNQNSPLLLGQSALVKLGKYSIKGNQLIIEEQKENTTSNSNSKDKNEAVNYLNLFLSDKSWGFESNANFIYNSYSKTLAYKSIIKYSDSKNTISETSYVLNIDDILKITEVIHKAEENKTGDHNIVFLNLILKNKIYYKKNIKSDGDIIPNYTNSFVDKITIKFFKSLTEQDLKSLSSVIRDIFENTEIETKNL